MTGVWRLENLTNSRDTWNELADTSQSYLRFSCNDRLKLRHMHTVRYHPHLIRLRSEVNLLRMFAYLLLDIAK
jgi:hypothetical protein